MIKSSIPKERVVTYAQLVTTLCPCTMLLLDELGKCPFVGKGSTGEYLMFIVMINLVKLGSCWYFLLNYLLTRLQ